MFALKIQMTQVLLLIRALVKAKPSLNRLRQFTLWVGVFYT